MTRNQKRRPEKPTRRVASPLPDRAWVEVYYATRIDSDIARARKEIADHIAGLSDATGNRIASRLESSSLIFKAAAKLELFEALQEFIAVEGWAKLKDFHESISADVMRKAQSASSRSTSQTANLMDACRLEVAAEFADQRFSMIRIDAWQEAPANADEAEAQRRAKQAEYDAQFASELLAYEIALAEWKAARQ